MRPKIIGFAIILCIIFSGVPGLQAQTQTLRVATYNIEWLGGTGHPSTPERTTRLQAVIAGLDADVIGLEEIADRESLRPIFPESEWQILIDDQSGDDQDVAIAVRLPFHIVGHPAGDNDIDASDSDFLYPTDDAANDRFFPNQRDVLFAEIQVPDSPNTFILMVNHAKSRSGGRTTTDPRREGAAQLIVQALEQRFDGKDIIYLGDLNDNPDDPSVNILETGDANAQPGPDDMSDDTFMINLTEPLLAEDHVSWGLTEANIDSATGKLNTVVPGSRLQNNATRGTSGVISPILFDQILVSPVMMTRYTLVSTIVFDDPAAQEGHHLGGNSGAAIDYASDHTPVVAEFTVGVTVTVTPQPTLPRVRIVELLPNPAGEDAGHETITLKNFGDSEISLAGWRLVDKAGNEYALNDTLAGGAQVVITLPSGVLPLNNNGDEVTLYASDDTQQDQVRYSGSDAVSGQAISFGE